MTYRILVNEHDEVILRHLDRPHQVCAACGRANSWVRADEPSRPLWAMLGHHKRYLSYCPRCCKHIKRAREGVPVSPTQDIAVATPERWSRMRLPIQEEFWQLEENDGRHWTSVMPYHHRHEAEQAIIAYQANYPERSYQISHYSRVVT